MIGATWTARCGSGSVPRHQSGGPRRRRPRVGHPGPGPRGDRREHAGRCEGNAGVTDVLEGVGERLDDIAAGEAGMPEDLPDDAGVPTELPPEEADIPIEMPAESEEWLD